MLFEYKYLAHYIKEEHWGREWEVDVFSDQSAHAQSRPLSHLSTFQANNNNNNLLLGGSITKSGLHRGLNTTYILALHFCEIRKNEGLENEIGLN